MTSDDAFSLSIGAALGDSDRENRAWGDAAMALARRVEVARTGVPSPLNVNVVFRVDGRLVPLDFTGVRTRRFSARTSDLLVQAAVPIGPAADRDAVLLRLLDEAIEAAEAFARKKKIAENLAEIRGIVASLSGS
ncbi:hypothetical protein [Kribbella sp. NPDC050459]|uniref:hypothetical protein n=1 Tax=Kribbella sp. NPDC050459 TaxID=3155785 RepID=UPI0033F117E2